MGGRGQSPEMSQSAPRWAVCSGEKASLQGLFLKVSLWDKSLWPWPRARIDLRVFRY